MKKNCIAFFCLLCITLQLQAQEYFTITSYNVGVVLNKDASLDVVETINVHFNEPRHGIIRFIPYKYPLQQLPAGAEKANRQLESGGYAHVLIEDINVDGWNYKVSREGDSKVIKIGSGDKTVDGNQQYVIRYRMLNAINFFKDHAELYFNIIGDKWETTIDTVQFSVSLYDALPATPDYFVATGPTGSKDNNTQSVWIGNKTFAGRTTLPLNYHEGVTVGVRLPKDFLTQQDYSLYGIQWLLLPVLAFFTMLLAWKRWGKDDKPTIQTEYYPPAGVSPSVCGHIIDDVLDRRDLTALIPYWGSGGYLQVRETEKEALLGLVKRKEYTFIKLKELPGNAEDFEHTLFNGIFAGGNEVPLSSLKDVLYKSMSTATTQAQSKVIREKYYVKGSTARVTLSIIAGLLLLALGIMMLAIQPNGYIWKGIALITAGIIVVVFGWFMRKKTEKGTALLQKLLGFKEFLKSVEKDRLKEFLKQDENYFDKILPFAIVFGIADTWKDKLEGLDIPPPNWYVGSYHHFNTGMFMGSLNSSLNQMSDTFYSSPKSSSSGGSFGGGGSSGGGFGGGGGSSW
ncbi:MAG: DUF2207 domain-containing protein [Ferruginibacter sp.]